MLRLARERPSLSIVSDQTGCPTWARNLAGVTRRVISHPGPQGVFHYCDGDAVTWFEFALAIFSAAMQAGLLQQMPEMTTVRSVDFPQKAERPLYSVLNTSKIREVFEIEPAGLHQALQSCLEEMAENE
jgi:dTDP-4-dehydrorhamnose reductase